MNKSILIDPLNDTKLSPKQTNFSIKSVLDQADETYDVDPVYQRDFVWKKRRQQKLIESIISGRAINAFHICRKNQKHNSNKFYVVDGKQRITTMRNFYRGKDANDQVFRVKVKMEDGTEKSLTYKQIEANMETDSNCAKIINNFIEYQLNFNIYENLTLDDQRELFECINESESLSSNEKIFCSNFLSRRFLREMFKMIFKDKITSYVGMKYKTNMRDKGTRLIVEFLLISFDKHFDSIFKVKDITPYDITQTVEILEDKLKTKFNISTETEITKKVIETVVGEKNIRLVEDCLYSMDYILSDKKDLMKDKMKDRDKSWFLDCMAWMMEKMQKNVLTKSYLSENYQKFYAIFRDFQKWSNDDSNLGLKFCNGKGASGGRMERRLAKLDELFYNPDNGFDVGIKNKGIPTRELTTALLASPQNDPTTGRLLRSDNVEIDHVKPKSLNSTTEYRAVDGHFNKKKGNIDQVFAENLVKYQKANA